MAAFARLLLVSTATSPPQRPPPRITRVASGREMGRERLAVRYARRTVTVPVYIASFLINTAGAPIFLIVALTGDLARRRGTVFVRCILTLWAYLAVEAFGLLLFIPLWLLGQGSEHRRLRLHHWFARVWVRWVFWSIVRLFEMRVVVEGDDDAAKGPVIVFCRHVSPVDNLLPLVFLEARHGMWLRWVMNSWLLRDPCIDFVGHRLRSTFLTVGSRQGLRQIAKISALGENLEPREGVLVFPEGALFTPRRLAHAVARLRRVGNEEEAQHAATLRHVLPPQVAGALALLERAPEADVVFCAHTGLEGGSYRAVLSGGLLRREVRIAFWRVSRHEVPEETEARTAWLHAQWRRVDHWIEENAPAGQGEDAAAPDSRESSAAS